jgi:predicted HNH restriction endonuclease
MEKICEICGNSFVTIKNGHSRKYCFECSPTSEDISSSCHHKTQLRRAMKKQAVKIKGGKCSICGYDKCIDALIFHHEDPSIKEFGLSNGDTRSWDKYLQELEKCILVCTNCHAEIHNKIMGA